MLKPGYTSIKRLIENVIRDTGFTSEIDWVDVIEWVYIACELIGVKNAYVLKVTDGNTDYNHPDPIEIENYRGSLPADFHMILQARLYDTKEPLRAATDSFFISTNSPDYTSGTNLTYNINNNYIFTSFESGEIEMAYYAFPTDADGLPLVPDDVMFLKALEAFIIERIGRKLWLKEKMSEEKYRALEQDWLFYVNSPRTKDALLTLDQMESLKNQTVKVATNFNSHASSFKSLGAQNQPLYLDNTYSWVQQITEV